MNSFLNTALKNLGIKTRILPNISTYKRRGSRNSLKGVDSGFKVDFDEQSGDSGFTQWKDAMKMVARLPDGIPADFRKQLWLTLASRYMESRNIDFEKIVSSCFHEKDDHKDCELGTQIIKDLHRTGCSLFSGDVAEQNQDHLKKVLLAYARWNTNVGYCQGFNMLAAIILEVADWIEKDALKVMIFLIEGVLPESYFANHLRGLSVDMAVFRDLLRMRLSSLSQHLDKLQSNAGDSSTGYSYEPPLTNVFTMQWFLTLFSNCLPKETVLRVWDLILLEGNEVLLRTALAIWDGLADRIMTVDSADEFYCIMGVLTREILEFGLMDANTLLKTICTLAPFPFPQLHELRDSYTYNIQPFTSSWSSGHNFHIFSGDADEEDNEDLVAASWCISNELHVSKERSLKGFVAPSSAFSSIGPGAFGASSDCHSLSSLSFTNFNTERMSLDISALKKQYIKLKERQKQAHIILTGALQSQFRNRSHNSLAVNHLLIGKKPLVRKKSIQTRVLFAEKNVSQRINCNETTQRTHFTQPIVSDSSVLVSKNVLSSPEKCWNEELDENSSSADSDSSQSCHGPATPQQSDSDSPESNETTLRPQFENKAVASVSNLLVSKTCCSESLPCCVASEILCSSNISESSPDKASSPVNPFPTRRRIGSMKQKKHENGSLMRRNFKSEQHSP